MGMGYLLLAIPGFVALAVAEWAWSRRTGRRVYRFNAALADVSCGATEVLLLRLLDGALLGAYALVYERARWWTFAPGGAAPWVLGLLGVDFAYYWWHRLSHRVNALWAAHVVHHQSEDFNLAVGLRQSVLTDITQRAFHLPLALLGVPPAALVAGVAVATLYQYWIHTEVVPKLGPLEWVLNTPSRHRVHHAINPGYLDTNYGATLMVWDRLFGTLATEAEPPVYGTTRPVRSFSVAWAHLDYLRELARASRAAPTARDALRVWLAPPSWTPPWVSPSADPPRTSPARALKYDPHLGAPGVVYLAINFALLAGGAFAAVVCADAFAPWKRVVIAAAVIVTLGAWGGLLDGRRRRAWAVEPWRWVAVALALAVVARGEPRMPFVLGVMLGLSALTLPLARQAADGESRL